MQTEVNSDYRNFTNQKQWKAYIQKLLYTNQKALLKALIVLYDFQEADEKMYGAAIHENKVGFSKNDSEILSKIAEKFISGQKLTQHEYYIVQTKIPHYWKQIMWRMKEKIKKEKDASELYTILSDGQLCFWWCLK